MNEFYSVILQSTYLGCLSYKKKVFESSIEGVKNFRGGRVKSLLPMKNKPFDKISSGVLSNMIVYFDLFS